ncbi:hypothetical protein AD998_15650 [bacterium 336/3]|nr:hypothetical protein AD998_15650 [bacterium 336/3]
MKNKLFILLLSFLSLNLLAQNKKKQDIQAIKNMCGCYEVRFSFVETFSPDKNYKPHSSHVSGGLEWVELVEDSKNKLVLQHLLIVEDSVGKKEIVKHWRQDWLYENTNFYMYEKENTWKFVQLPKGQVRGQWTQKVFQVDDSPRYEGTATWIHTDGRHYWENTAMSPLPRREFTTRNDYNVLKRRNRHEITQDGWVHEQDNDKISKIETKETLIAQEKGWNTYKKVDSKRCEEAQKYWQQKKDFWATVREVWDAIFNENKTLVLEKIVDKKPLFAYLFALKQNEQTEVKSVINKFVKRN